MKRVWDEVGCEFYDYDPDCFEDRDDEDDSEYLEELFCDGVDPIHIGYFNGGRHVFFEVSGTAEAVRAFEEAFELSFQIYDVGLNHGEIAEIIPKCGADRLLYLRQRKEEYDEESAKAKAESDKEQQQERSRWHGSEWCNLEKIAQAARDAGWKEKPEDHHYGKEQKRYGFYHDIGPNEAGTILRLELDADDSREFVPDFWLHDSTELVYKGGSTSCFGGWNMLPKQQYVTNIEFIDRWLGIPTPQQAVTALKQILAWEDFLGSHMREYCAGFDLS